MKKVIPVLSFLLASFAHSYAHSQTAADQHPLTAHVTASRVVEESWVSNGNTTGPVLVLHISATIEDRHYEMEAKNKQGKKTKNELLVLGDYKAGLVKDEHSKPYRSYRVYEFQYPDGETEHFTVVGETNL